MYADLLAAAVADAVAARSSGPGLSADDLVEMVRESHDLGGGAGEEGHLDLADAVADELRYDALLVMLCERVGIDVDLRDFGRPLAERQRLERELVGLGILPAVE